MSLDLSPAGVFGWASGVALLGLAALVLRLRPVRPLVVGFALFSAGVGLAAFTISILTVDDPLWTRFLWAGTPSLLLSVAGAALLAAFFPTPIERDRRWPLVAAALAGIGVAVAVLLVIGSAPPAPVGGAPAEAARVVRFLDTAGWAFRGVDVGLLLVFALRYPALGPAAQRAVAVVSAGLVLYPASYMGRVLVGAARAPAEGTGPILASIVILALLAWAAVWLAHGARDPAHARTTRVVAWIGLGSIAVGTAFPLLARLGGADLVEGASGIARLAAVAVWAVAIFRHQALGVDAKVRFAISKSTLAAAFFAVFFVASEAAQQFFGETLGSSYVGILAAGALVFAIAPLSRLADRLAEKAVPIPSADPAPPPANGDHETAYRDALRLALRDRRLTRAEEAQLHRLAEALGIRPGRAHEMLAEVERDTGAGVE